MILLGNKKDSKEKCISVYINRNKYYDVFVLVYKNCVFK